MTIIYNETNQGSKHFFLFLLIFFLTSHLQILIFYKVNNLVNIIRKKLTEKQEKILEALEEFILKKGYSPTIRQLGELVKIASPSAVHKHILSLEKKDHLEVEKRGAVSSACFCLGKLNIKKTWPNSEICSCICTGKWRTGKSFKY